MSTPITVDDLREKRDIAAQAAKNIERKINEIQTRMAQIDQEKSHLASLQQQAFAEHLSAQALVSGLSIALGEEPVPNAVSTPLLVSMGLASTGQQKA